MDLGEMFRLLRRRWFVAVPALLITVVATAGVYAVWPTKYQSVAQLTLLTSRSVATQQGDSGNPYLAFTPAQVAVVDLLARNLSSGQSASQLAALGVTNSYTAALAANAQGPFMAITVTGKNRAELMRSMPIMIAFAQRRLTELQNASEAPVKSQLQLVVIVPPGAPTPVRKTKIELVAGVAVLGLVGSFLLCFIVDHMLSSRPKRRNQRLAVAADSRRGAARAHDWPEEAPRPARTP